jgi:hypothetical protein
MHEVTFKTIATVVEVDGRYTSLVTIIWASPESKLRPSQTYQGTGTTTTEALRSAHEKIFAAVEGK